MFCPHQNYLTKTIRPCLLVIASNMETITGVFYLVPRAKMLDFDDIYQENRAKIYAQCLGFTHNSADAEDLTQEVFLKAWRKLSQFRGDCALSTWLYTIARREFLMSLRHPRAKADYVTDYPDLIAPNTCPLLRIALKEAVERLPGKLVRENFISHCVYGYENAETAAQLDISLSASKASCQRAKRHLRK